MDVTVGTFNLNNLFSRFNFRGEIGKTQGPQAEVGASVKYEFGPEAT